MYLWYGQITVPTLGIEVILGYDKGKMDITNNMFTLTYYLL